MLIESLLVKEVKLILTKGHSAGVTLSFEPYEVKGPLSLADAIVSLSVFYFWKLTKLSLAAYFLGYLQYMNQLTRGVSCLASPLYRPLLGLNQGGYRGFFVGLGLGV